MAGSYVGVGGGSRAPYGRDGISYGKRGGWAFQAEVAARAEAPEGKQLPSNVAAAEFFFNIQQPAFE